MAAALARIRLLLTQREVRPIRKAAVATAARRCGEAGGSLRPSSVSPQNSSPLSPDAAVTSRTHTASYASAAARCIMSIRYRAYPPWRRSLAS